jgi:lon-related putative ATP-dependent protease
LHRANGGYLVLDAARLLAQPYAWEALKRALSAREVNIESLGAMLSLVSTSTIEPEPVKLDVKVVLVGPRDLHELLSMFDEDFNALFSVVADFAEHVERSPDALMPYAGMLATQARRAGLRALGRDAVARVIEHGARMTGDALRLTLQVRSLQDLLREADYQAREAGRELIGAADVERAIDAQMRRVDRWREQWQQEIQRWHVHIETDGAEVAQVNGLSVVELGGAMFGHPSRITATVRVGDGEVVDIEREIKLGGAIHSKGVMILSAFIASRYAADAVLSLRGTVVFEQTYGGVDGDSASLAETCALLSALAGLPLRQSLAVTGSIDQHGRVQVVGGVSDKIEGFFDVCAQRGLTGPQGVLIPAHNIEHLMLRSRVVDAVAQGKFHIYPVHGVDEAMALLTGVPAGLRETGGAWTPGSVNARVQQRLLGFASIVREFTRSGPDAAAAGPDAGPPSGAVT